MVKRRGTNVMPKEIPTLPFGGGSWANTMPQHEVHPRAFCERYVSGYCHTNAASNAMRMKHIVGLSWENAMHQNTMPAVLLLLLLLLLPLLLPLLLLLLLRLLLLLLWLLLSIAPTGRASTMPMAMAPANKHANVIFVVVLLLVLLLQHVWLRW